VGLTRLEGPPELDGREVINIVLTPEAQVEALAVTRRFPGMWLGQWPLVTHQSAQMGPASRCPSKALSL
jgi:hypothetical protein